jgi:polysaccharide deacetylase family protein (PEP-CTERM system associated)
MLSIDVEDWFHLVGAGLEYQFKKDPGGTEAWAGFTPRIEQNTYWILDLLDKYQVKATFFILGWVAEHFPALVMEIHKSGHEVASHSYWHRLVTSQTQEQFRQDLKRSLDVIQNVTGSRVLGFRASSASITPWAIDIIHQEGLLYDSSLFPASYHDVYGKLPGVSKDKPIERLSNGLLEVKMTSIKLLGMQLPWSGGGYFRLLPYPIFCLGMRHVLKDKHIFNFFIHPWELDDAPPKLVDLKPIYSFRRYISITRTRTRFESLLKEYPFVPIYNALQNLGYIKVG